MASPQFTLQDISKYTTFLRLTKILLNRSICFQLIQMIYFIQISQLCMLQNKKTISNQTRKKK
ncbi:hypothetical protein pb186bvf_008630 [Paramecium bursaria]